MKLKIIFIILVLFFCSYLFAEIEELFFSEYIEGSSNNKALEIYNGTGADVDLADYRINQSVDGGGWQYQHYFPTGATITDGDVWVITTNQADAILQNAADEILPFPSVVHFNGDDARGLEKTTDGSETWTLLDVIGVPGEDPGDGWAVAGVNNATKEHTLVRKSTVEAPTTDWALSAGTNPSESQWEVYDQNTFDYIGFHIFGADIIPPTLNSAVALSSSSVEITFSEPLDETTSENTGNYSINPFLDISSASLATNKVILTTSEQTEAENYTITVNNVEDLAGNPIEAGSSIDFTGYGGTQYDLIADIQNNLDDYLAQEVTVRAVVTIGDGLLYAGKTQFYIQDESGRGIQIFDHTPLATTYVRGDLVKVTGIVGLYTGTENKYYDVQITESEVTLISQGEELPEPYEATGSEDFTMNGTWASATGEIVDIWDSIYGFYQIVVSVNGVEMDLQFWDSTGANVEEYVVGDEITAHGVIAFYEDIPQLSCAYEEDIDYYIDDIYDDINFEKPVNPGESVLVGFPYEEPCNSVFLHWKTNRDFEFHTIEMDTTSTRETEYFATIPGQSAGTSVTFYISVFDTLNTEILFPTNFPTEFFEYHYEITYHAAKLNIPAKPFNPYAGEKFPIEFASKSGDKAILRIYNAEGKLVFTPQNIIISGPTGITHYNWNGRDKNHKLLPLGLYICYLEVIEANTGKKKTAKAPIVIGAPLK
ncbi:MAG: lamin tail domain-containing protein [Candidatus Cloacimonetes bacterium]|nr:lamin tail domain-containing protein [Candidatus Cloacimonadota bacterium]